MAMPISSPTPEGAPNWCPACRAAICVDPSPMGDAPCPTCGTLLWFFETPNGTACCRFVAIAALRERVLAIIARDRGLTLEEVIEDYKTRIPHGADALDLVEWTMELEEELGFRIPLARTERLESSRDLVDYVLRIGMRSNG